MGLGTMLAFDANVFIYMLEDNPEFTAAAKNALRSVLEGRAGGCVSVLVITEVLSGTKGSDSSFVTNAPFRVCEVNAQIAVLAGQLRQQHAGLKTADAIHLATARLEGAKQFITNDKKLFGLDVGLNIVPLSSFSENR